jgi:signal transduction histidine kinase
VAEVFPVRVQRPSARGPWPAAALVATAAAGGFAAIAAHPGDVAAAGGDLAVALVFVTCGAALWVRRVGELSGPLMVATGFAWLLGDLSDALALLHRGPLVQLLVAAPDGRPRTLVEWMVVVAGYADALVASVGSDEGATVALVVAVAAVGVGRWARAGGIRRRQRTVPAAATVAIALVLGVGVTADAAHGETVMWCYEAVLIVTAAALFVDLRRGWIRDAVTNVVIDLGSGPGGGSLEAALARAVGDPLLVVGYGVGDGRFVDERGRRVDLPSAGADRVVTSVDTGGSSAAVLVHHRAALRTPGLADSVAAAVRLALDNVRLQSEIRARLRDVDVSRARLLQARDSERRSLEGRLRAGVGRGLERAARELAGLEDDRDALVSALPGELDRARAELHRFAAGLHPHDLEAGGLPVALPALAAGAPLPVDVSVDCGRLAPRVEAAAWFVCSEALANVVKHAAATRATVRVERSGRWLVVTVGDDGRGGADPSAGRGLRGLAARVEAAGGRLAVEERPGRGTLLQAWLATQEPT